MPEYGMSEAKLPMLEVPCPEYFVTEIGRIEPAGRDNLRFYCCTLRGRVLEPKYSVVVPIQDLIAMARLCMQAAADHHNQITMSALPRVAH